MNGDPKASPTSNMVGIEPPYDMALPKITPEIWEVYQDEEFIEDSPRWEWTQAAVDFACEIVRPAVRAEIERLKRGNEILRDELAKIDALHDSVQSERDRLRAALEKIANGGICGSHETHFECPQSEDVCAIARAALSDEPESAVETTASPQAPIARVTVKADRCYAVEFYTPGLPPGEHDLYCEPEAVAPMMREKRAYYETHDPPHCPTCGCGAHETERQIREDIKVGSTLFRAGVKLRIVLERIERGFSYHLAGDPPCGG